MTVIDLNVLVALFIAEHPHHERARSWWAGPDADGGLVVPDIVWVGFLRIVTSRRGFPTPRSFAEAWSFVDALSGSGAVSPAPSGSRVLASLQTIAGGASARGDLITDAYIAAVAVSLGASVVTFDRDFRKFDGVRVVEPA